MADNTHQYGFRIHGSRMGDNPKPERVRVASGCRFQDVNSAYCNLNVGDPVTKVSDGTVALCAGGASAPSLYGIVTNILPYWDGTVMRWNKFLPDNTVYSTNYERQSFVEILPVAGYLFEVDVQETSASFDTYAEYYAFIGENADHSNYGDTTNLTANPGLVLSSGRGTGTAQWRIVDVSPTLANQDFSGKYVKLIVTANEVQQAPFATTGV
jgi:hypothetical protein